MIVAFILSSSMDYQYTCCYVDDMLIVAKRKKEITTLKA
jgi:hypothetical protein